jgi:hypothetical protein
MPTQRHKAQLKLYNRIKALCTVQWSNQVYDRTDLIQDIWIEFQGSSEVTDEQIKKRIQSAVYQKLKPRIPIYHSSYGFDELENMGAKIGMPINEPKEPTINPQLFEEIREAFIKKGVDKIISEIIHDPSS